MKKYEIVGNLSMVVALIPNPKKNAYSFVS